MQIYQKSVAMIGGKIKVGKKVCPDYAIFHLGDGEIEFKISLPYSNCASSVTIASDLGTVGGAQLRTGGA